MSDFVLIASLGAMLATRVLDFRERRRAQEMSRPASGRFTIAFVVAAVVLIGWFIATGNAYDLTYRTG